MKRKTYKITCNNNEIGTKFSWNTARKFIYQYIKTNMTGTSAEFVSQVNDKKFTNGTLFFIDNETNEYIFTIKLVPRLP